MIYSNEVQIRPLFITNLAKFHDIVEPEILEQSRSNEASEEACNTRRIPYHSQFIIMVLGLLFGCALILTHKLV